MSKTLIFSATYNEKDNIKELIYQINRFKENLDILIIDDNSPDQTGEILVKLKSKFNNLISIHREQKLGLDTAHKFAYQYAINNGYTKLITMDADLSHDPKEIPVLISLLDKHEFVIGSRYMEGGKCEMQGFRLLMSIIGNKVIRLVLRLKCTEFTSSYRGFNIKKLQNFNLNIVKSKGYSFFMESIFRIAQNGYKIHQIPITFKNRTKGESKIPKIEILRTIKNLLILKLIE